MSKKLIVAVFSSNDVGSLPDEILEVDENMAIWEIFSFHAPKKEKAILKLHIFEDCRKREDEYEQLSHK